MKLSNRIGFYNFRKGAPEIKDILKKNKVLFGIIVAAGIAGILYFVLGRPQKSSGAYLTDTVKRSNLTSSVSASGTVEPVGYSVIANKASRLDPIDALRFEK